MRAWVGVTDGDWYRFLAVRPKLSEVNFWRPNNTGRFKALRHGEPFFFKSKYPQNRVVGGGFFTGSFRLPLSEAWDFFGESNGAATLDDLRLKVARYRQGGIGPGEDPTIGCVFVRDVQFFATDSPADPPPDWARSIVQGKGYDLAASSNGGYFADLMHRLLGGSLEVDIGMPWHLPGPVYGDPRLTPQRLGQGSFQVHVLDAYHRRCAITGDRIRPVLQAAHIRPLPKGGEHRLDNGLLLRSDVHTLYDRGYLGFDPAHRLLVSPKLRSEFGNGEEFYGRAGQVIDVPERRPDQPSSEFLEWHLDEVFLAW